MRTPRILFGRIGLRRSIRSRWVHRAWFDDPVSELESRPSVAERL